MSIAHQYLVKRISAIVKLLKAISEFRNADLSVSESKPIYNGLSYLSNTVMSFRSNINWEIASQDERLRRALGNEMQYEVAVKYATANNFEEAKENSDFNGLIGGRAYGLAFDIYLRAMLRENPRLEGSSSFAQPDPWYVTNIDRIEQNLLSGLDNLVEALIEINEAFAGQ